MTGPPDAHHLVPVGGGESEATPIRRPGHVCRGGMGAGEISDNKLRQAEFGYSDLPLSQLRRRRPTVRLLIVTQFFSTYGQIVIQLFTSQPLRLKCRIPKFHGQNANPSHVHELSQPYPSRKSSRSGAAMSQVSGYDLGLC